jgi:YfiR/HmsC-like
VNQAKTGIMPLKFFICGAGWEKRAARLALPFLVMAGLAANPTEMEAQPPISKEYQIKAAFLFNFAQFVEWPATAFTNADAPLCIGILGDDPFGPALEETLKDETIHDRKLTVLRSHHVEDLKACQMVFINQSEKDRIPEILGVLKSNTLTVSETDGFARHGGSINFFRDGKKVRFEINPGAAQREGLKMSSQLLSLGKIVNSEGAQ